jgi:hypothetical protein
MVLLGSAFVVIGRRRRGASGQGYLEVAQSSQGAGLAKSAPVDSKESGTLGSLSSWRSRSSWRAPRAP